MYESDCLHGQLMTLYRIGEQKPAALLRFLWQGKWYAVQPEEAEKKLQTNPFAGLRVTLLLRKEAKEPEKKNAPEGVFFAAERADGSRGYFAVRNQKLTFVKTLSQADAFAVRSAGSWVTFGELYLNACGFQQTGHRLDSVSERNYQRNRERGLDAENYETYQGNKMLVNQYGGAFPELRYHAVTMDGVCCEIMAAKNLLTLTGRSIDFFRLAAEFSYNAVLVPPVLGWITKKGRWGSNPKKIAACLQAYGIPYQEVKKDKDQPVPEQLDTVRKNCCGITAYWFPVFYKICGIHTYAFATERDGVRCFNRYSDQKHSAWYFTQRETMQKKGTRLLCAYIAEQVEHNP